jgi:hypothetical protein
MNASDNVFRVAALVVMASLGGCGSGGGDNGGPNPSLPGVPPAWGQLDASFGNEGKFVSDSTFAATPRPTIVLDRDGNLYVVALREIEKRDHTGRLVPSFGNAGRVTVADIVSSPTLDGTDGLLLISGSTLFKLDSTGTVASSFGTGGFVSWSDGAWGAVFAFPLAGRDSGGHIYLVGSVFTPGEGFRMGAIAKLDPAGRLDTSFGNAGIAIFESAIRGRPLSSPKLAFGPDGSIFLAGGIVLKLDARGTLASDFGEGGFLEVPACAANRESNAAALAFDALGNLVVGANCTPTTIEQPYVFKFTPEGAMMDSFRAGGLRPGLFGSTEGTASVRALSIAADGSIYVAGERERSGGACGSDTVLAKLDAGGIQVPTIDGRDAVVLEGQPVDRLIDLSIDAQGALYAGATRIPICSVSRPTASAFVVFRLKG